MRLPTIRLVISCCTASDCSATARASVSFSACDDTPRSSNTTGAVLRDDLSRCGGRMMRMEKLLASPNTDPGTFSLSAR